ncbi:MAG: hypothetical protein IJ122_06365 [Methanobrevibacter sp.]|nr:hypothetical protein [Methanobrevibacter sp.]
MNQFTSIIEQIREIFPQLDDPKNLNSLDACKSWFKDYKKAIKEVDQEWNYCKEVLRALNEFDSKLTKNQAYLKENSLMINNLYTNYVKE